MFRLPARTLAPVFSQCGLHVMIDPLAGDFLRQVWRIDLAFVPGDEDAGPPPWAVNELWRLHVAPIAGLRLADWRELENLVLHSEDESAVPILLASLENLCDHRSAPRDANVYDCRFLKRDRYGFMLQMEGEILPPAGETPADGVCGDFRLFMEIPFASAEVAVPVNATDPAAAGLALAGREVGLRKCARSSFTPFDPERAAGPFGRHFNKHVVRLETPWRGGAS